MLHFSVSFRYKIDALTECDVTSGFLSVCLSVCVMSVNHCLLSLYALCGQLLYQTLYEHAHHEVTTLSRSLTLLWF